jgi:hypothetical protein
VVDNVVELKILLFKTILDELSYKNISDFKLLFNVI